MPRPHPVFAQRLPKLEELRSWLEPAAAAPSRVTAYLPLQRAIPDVRQNPLLLERAAREAEQGLLEIGVSASRAHDRADAIRRVEIDLATLGPGPAALALLIDDETTRCVALHVPTAYQVVVGSAFALRPLLIAWHAHARYRVLAVSINRIACFEATPEGIALIELPDVPTSLADALGEQLTEKELRMRGTARGGSAPAYYSHGSARDEREVDLTRFHEVLTRALTPALADPSLPVVLAATDDHQSGLRAGHKLPALLDEPLTGNFDHAAPAALHERAGPIVARWLERRRDEALAGWERARNRGKTADLLDDVAAAALAGRVQRLWVDAARTLPGELDPVTGRCLPDGANDVLDAIVELVLRKGGEVRPVEAERLPSTTGAAAELR